MCWDQRREEMVVGGGEPRFLRVWDAEKELKLQDIPTGADAPITTISIDPAGKA